MYAANGTKIPVMGAVTISFEVAGVPVNCRFLVSDAVDEPLLAIDWLERNNCAWDFVRGTLLISGKEIPLVGRPRRPTVRRVYVEENVVVSPRTEVGMPVRLTWTSFERGVNNTEWLMETKHTPNGVTVAKSLLPKDASKTYVKAVNLSDQPCSVLVDSCIGSAYPAEVVADRCDVDISDPPTAGGGARDPPILVAWLEPRPIKVAGPRYILLILVHWAVTTFGQLLTLLLVLCPQLNSLLPNV